MGKDAKLVRKGRSGNSVNDDVCDARSAKYPYTLTACDRSPSIVIAIEMTDAYSYPPSTTTVSGSAAAKAGV
ncbi:MAG TPA: hypothetical protein DCG12_24490 [Planctomycetaceae bacterium]|nr:hypothetical protein [Planctomycetaceae bacterium]